MSVSLGMSTLFPDILPHLATVLSGFSLVVFAIRKGRSQRESRIYAICCIAVSFAVLLGLVGRIKGTGGITGYLVGTAGILSICAIPLSVHILHAVFGRLGTPWVIKALYALALLVAAFELSMGGDGMIAAGWYAPAAFIGAASGGFIVIRSLREQAEPFVRLKTMLLVSGVMILLLLIGLEGFTFFRGQTLSLAFIPLIMISIGLFGHMDRISSHPVTRAELVSTLIIALGLVPIITDIIILYVSTSVFKETDQTLLEYIYQAANVVSLMACTGIALFSYHRAGRRIEVILLSVMAMLCAVLNLRDMVAIRAGDDLKRIILMNDLFLAMFIGVIMQLASRVSGMGRSREVLFFYGLGGLIMTFLAWKALFPGLETDGLSAAARGMEHFAFIGVMVFTLGRSIMMLQARRAIESEPGVKKKVSFIMAGLSLACLIVIASVAMALFTQVYTFNFSIFIAVVLVAYGIFSLDMTHINVHMKRQILSLVLRSAVVAAYAVAVFLIWLLLKGLSFEYIASRIVPYGIPPLLSFMSAAFLSLFVLRIEQHRPETFPFSMICFCYAVLNLDILLVGIIPDMQIALWISRIDHFFLALLLLGANLHLVYLIIGKKDQWWVVYLGYLIGVIMAPLTLTDWYFTGMYTYYWGYFAKKAVLYDLMSTLWMSAFFWVIYLLFTSFRKTEAFRRRNIRNVLIAFFLIASLSMANTPAIYGYEVYPLGTFVFIALFFLTYGLFKFNMAIALQYIRTLLLWTGLVISLMAIGTGPYLIGILEDKGVALQAGIILVVLIYSPLKKSLDAVMDLFIRKSWDVLDEEYKIFTEDLSHLHHLDELHARMSTWIFEVFNPLSLTSLFSTKVSDVFEGWSSVNETVFSGLFGKPEEYRAASRSVCIRRDDPLIRLCLGAYSMITRAEFFRSLNRVEGSDWESGFFKDIDMILPIRSHEDLLAIFLVGGKADGSRYSRQEMDMLSNVTLFLGPHVENTKLLENLEGVVEDRTKDLNAALVEAMLKERQIKERNVVIERQNQIMAVLLETNTRMQAIGTLDELFGFTLAQLKSLFPEVCAGIILEDPKRNILEASAFVGLNEAEQKAILNHRDRMNEPDIDVILRTAMKAEEIHQAENETRQWKVIPLQGGSERSKGFMIGKEQDLEGTPSETVNLFIAQISSVVQNKLLLNRLERMASTDGLTGVYNRSFLDRELEKAINHAKRFSGMYFSLMIIDVNGLKRVNDTHGHGVGDEVIVKVAGLLRSACREMDITSRIGGDEFAILMPSTNRLQAEVVNARIRDGEKGLRVLLMSSQGESVNIPIRISIGLASSDEAEPEMVMKTADDLMYLDKQNYYSGQTNQSGFA